MNRDAEAGPPVLQMDRSMPVPGDVVGGKYRIGGVIGRGGMSVVYRATHLQLDQPVALKVLSSEALLVPEYVERLKREAQAVSKIRSDHVARVYDIGELDDSHAPYLVMEYLEGLDLAAMLVRRGPLPVQLAIDCVMQSCDALAEVHALGIVHRDLKPANLFLTESVDGLPCIKVLDFGISRRAPAPTAGTNAKSFVALTNPGTVLGTPTYMAPEQMEGGQCVDARSDIWALGTILYEVLVGKPPFTGDSLPQLFVKIMRSPPPRPSAVRAHIPDKIDAIVARCLAVDPRHRYQNVAELAVALSGATTPRGRAKELAQRVSRVVERHGSGAPYEVGAMTRTPRTSERSAPRPTPRRLAATFGTTAFLGAVLALGLMHARGPGVSSVDVSAGVESDRLHDEAVVDDALAIARISRPPSGDVLAVRAHAASRVVPQERGMASRAQSGRGGVMVAVSLPASIGSPPPTSLPSGAETDAPESQIGDPDDVTLSSDVPASPKMDPRSRRDGGAPPPSRAKSNAPGNAPASPDEPIDAGAPPPLSFASPLAAPDR